MLGCVQMRAFFSHQIDRNQLDTACQHIQELSGKIICKGSSVRSGELLEIICNSPEQFDRFPSLLKPCDLCCKANAGNKEPMPIC